MMWMGFFWVILLVGVIVLVIKLLSDNYRAAPTKETALDILKKEYAKGNITEAEYLERKKHLE